MHIGLYFGSFNPIHTGHLIIANHIVGHTDIDKIWFVVSPHNPLKDANSLLNEYDRLHLVQLAIADNEKFRASNVEFHLPKPSYTIDTLAYLRERFPLEQFSVIIGSDSYQNIRKWKNYEQILEHYAIYVYRRPGFDLDSDQLPPGVNYLQAPMLDISSTHIRNEIVENRSIKYLVHPDVAGYIHENRYYSGKVKK